MNNTLECQYEGCTEEFDSHEERLEHSMSEHTDLNPKRYPSMTGARDGLKF